MTLAYYFDKLCRHRLVPACCTPRSTLPVSRRRRAWGGCLLGAALWIVFSLLLPVALPVAAQEQSPVQLDVQVGYGGRYRISQWFPVTVVASNDGPDLRGVLEWRFPGQDAGNSFQRELDLPRGARKRLTLNVFSNDFVRSGEVRFLLGRNAVAAQTVRLEPVDPGQMMIGIVSSDDTLLNSLSAMSYNNASGVSITHFSDELLPDNAVALSGLDVIFIHDTVTANLSPPQRAALELWVRLGGQLVVGGGVNAERTVTGLAELLPVQVRDLVGDAALTSLNEVVPGNNNSPLPQSTINRVELQPGATALDTQQLLTTRAFGDGQVTFSAFDLSVLRAWDDEPELWQQVLKVDPRLDPASSYRWQGENILRNALQLPALRLPPFWVLLLFLFVYIVVVGPLNFLLLRRIGRVELAWLTVPALVMVFVVGTYATSFVLRGTRPQISQVAIVQGFEDQQRGQATAFLGVFSPRRSTYSLVFPPDTLVSSGRLDGVTTGGTPLVWTDAGSEVRDVLVDVSALRSFVLEQTIAAVPPVGSMLQRNQRAVQGEVQNLDSEPLVDALLVTGDAVQSLGTLQPGERRGVNLQGTESNFPGAVNVATEGLFNRETILSNLFTTNQFGLSGPVVPNFQPVQGLPDRDGVYLLAWREKAAVTVEVNGSSSDLQGLTLYIIRLDI